MLEQAEILLRRAQADRHLVERHAARGFVEHPADDSHCFTPLARRGGTARTSPVRSRTGVVLRTCTGAVSRDSEPRAASSAVSGFGRTSSSSSTSPPKSTSAARAKRSPSGTVASTSGDRSTRAATSSRSARESIGTSRRTIPNPCRSNEAPAGDLGGDPKSAARLSTPAWASCSSTRASNRPISRLAGSGPSPSPASSVAACPCAPSGFSRTDSMPASLKLGQCPCQRLRKTGH